MFASVFHVRGSFLLTLAASVALGLSSAASVDACPFCAAVGLTLGDEIDAASVAAIAQFRRPGSDDPNADIEASKAEFTIVRVIKGKELLGEQRSLRTLYYGQVQPGTRFLVFGNNPPQLTWQSPVMLTPRGLDYLNTMLSFPPKGPQRLVVAFNHLEDPEEMLRRDTYDEFARAPFSDLKALGPKLDADLIVKRIADPAIPAQRVRLYSMLLSVSGNSSHAPAIEAMLRSGKTQFANSLDAMITAYLRLKGPQGLPMVEEVFLKSEAVEDGPKANAAINALRFYGQEPDVIPQDKVVEIMRSLLDRPQLAARVLADLARWAKKPEDWRDVDRVAKLFEEAKGDTLWVREPAVGYLRECPLPAAKAQLERLATIDPAAVKRGSSLLPENSTVFLGGGPANPPAKTVPVPVSSNPSPVVSPPAQQPGSDAGSPEFAGPDLRLLWVLVAGAGLSVVLLAWAFLRLRGRPAG